MYLIVQEKLKNVFQIISTAFVLEAKPAMTKMRIALFDKNTSMDCDVAQGGVVLRNRLEKVRKTRSIKEAFTDVSIDQGPGPSGAPENCGHVMVFVCFCLILFVHSRFRGS